MQPAVEIEAARTDELQQRTAHGDVAHAHAPVGDQQVRATGQDEQLFAAAGLRLPALQRVLTSAGLGATS